MTTLHRISWIVNSIRQPDCRFVKCHNLDWKMLQVVGFCCIEETRLVEQLFPLMRFDCIPYRVSGLFLCNVW
jgi:hypothetical protein